MLFRSAYVDRCDIALGDSEFNRRDLVSLGFPRTGVLPVVPDLTHLDAPAKIDVVLVNGDPNPNRPDLPSYGAGETVCKPMIAAVAKLMSNMDLVLGAAGLSLWVKTQTAVAQAGAALGSLEGKSDTFLPADLLQGTTPLAVCGVLALLTLALYLSLAEEH